MMTAAAPTLERLVRLPVIYRITSMTYLLFVAVGLGRTPVMSTASTGLLVRLRLGQHLGRPLWTGQIALYRQFVVSNSHLWFLHFA